MAVNMGPTGPPVDKIVFMEFLPDSVKQRLSQMWSAVLQDFERYGVIEGLSLELGGFDRHAESLIDEPGIEITAHSDSH